MTVYLCEACNITSFSNKQSYQRHIASKKHIMASNENTKRYNCGCGKWFLYSSGLSAHKKKCNKQNETNTIKNSIELMQQKILDFEKEREEMKAQIAMLLDKHASTTNNTNIDTQNNNITININAFGNENIDYIDDKAILQCIEKVYKSVPALLEKIHFDPHHPENHNIKITNKKLPYASVMGNNKKWKTVDRKLAIENMVHKGYNILEDKYAENKDKVNTKKQTNFEGFQDRYESQDPELLKNLKNDIDIMILNG